MKSIQSGLFKIILKLNQHGFISAMLTKLIYYML